jgi:hypothetical protein
MHERVTGLRANSNFYLVGVDKTQSIALDEIFGKKVVDVQGIERQTKVYRVTRTSKQVTPSIAERDGTNASLNENPA